MDASTMTAITLGGLRVDARSSPIGIGSSQPEFAWTVETAPSGYRQTAWRVRVWSPVDGGELWDSGPVADEVPFGHCYAGPSLRSNTAYHWAAQVQDAESGWSGWSEPSSFETGILDPALWTADWVTAPTPTAGALYLRGVISLPWSATVVRARAYVSSLGWHRFFVNGTDLTGPALVPRFTPFGEEVEYQVYDVTAALHAGDNVLAMAVGDGRFRGHLGYFDRAEVFGERLAGLAQLHIDLSDGQSMVVGSDVSWDAGTGRITTTDPKYGEQADLRIAEWDWLTARRRPLRFTGVETLSAPSRRLVAEQVARVGVVQRFRPRVWRSAAGAQLVDVGQNISGVLRIRLDGPAGRRIRLTFSEVLDPAGELDTHWIVQNPLRPWYQRDEVVLDGTVQWWQPWFTSHGFRFVEVEGLDGDLGVDDVEALALSTDVAASGAFRASDDRLSRLWQNVYWSTRSNFTDTPTDCPTRERSGWTGDIQVFASTATGIVDSQAFLRRYLHNVALEQGEDGNVPPWIPSERTGRTTVRHALIDRILGNSVGWGDVTVLTPWAMYRYYGDTLTLRRQYRSMQLWVRRLGRAARRRGPARWFAPVRPRHDPYILDSGFHWGEWLRPGEHFPVNMLDGTFRSPALTTAYFEHSARVLSDVAAVLGHRVDHARYLELADRVRLAWRAAFLRAGGTRLGRDRQDDYVRALAFGLLDPDEIPVAADRLVELIRAAGTHLATGFLSTPMLLGVLVDAGRAEVALDLLFQTTDPSWLGQLEHDATTIWETWQGGYEIDGRAHASHNHYAFGAVAGFLRERLAGIRPLEPGYRQILVRPLVTDRLDWVDASVDTPFGRARSRWELTAGSGTLAVTVPPGATGRIDLPDGSTHHRGSGDWEFAWTP